MGTETAKDDMMASANSILLVKLNKSPDGDGNALKINVLTKVVVV